MGFPLIVVDDSRAKCCLQTSRNEACSRLTRHLHTLSRFPPPQPGPPSHPSEFLSDLANVLAAVQDLPSSPGEEFVIEGKEEEEMTRRREERSKKTHSPQEEALIAPPPPPPRDRHRIPVQSERSPSAFSSILSHSSSFLIFSPPPPPPPPPHPPHVREVTLVERREIFHRDVPFVVNRRRQLREEKNLRKREAEREGESIRSRNSPRLSGNTTREKHLISKKRVLVSHTE